MELLTQIPQYGFWFLLILTGLIFVHELGHFLVARLCGVKVEVFSIGFGGELFGFTDRYGTRWKFGVLPLGGYVRMFGQGENLFEGAASEAEDDQAGERARSFRHKGVAQRIAIVAAGPAANYLFAILMLAATYATVGKRIILPVVGEVMQGSAAEEAGVKPGDKIVALNGVPVTLFNQVAETVALNLAQPLQMTLQRAGQEISVEAHPKISEEIDIFGSAHRLGRLGIKSADIGEVVVFSPVSALSQGVSESYALSVNMLTGLWQMLTGVRSADEIGGVLRIAKMSGDVAQIGVIPLLNFMVLLSINLGLLNLFPVPMLDGGHLAFYMFEAIRGRPVSERVMEWGGRVGLAMVLCLMVFATWNDLVSLKIIAYIRALLS